MIVDITRSVGGLQVYKTDFIQKIKRIIVEVKEAKMVKLTQ